MQVSTPRRGYGWVAFAGVMLMLVGGFNILNGIVAITKDEYLVDDLLFGDVSAWGWFFLVWGVIQLLAALAIFAGSALGTGIGIAAAFLNALAQLAWLRSNPVWSVIIIAVDVLVMYGLVVYGGRPELVE